MSTGDSNSNNVHIFWISSLLNSLLPFTFLYRVDSLIFKYSATSDIVFPFSITAALNFNLLNNCFSSLLLRFRKLTITPFLRLRHSEAPRLQMCALTVQLRQTGKAPYIKGWRFPARFFILFQTEKSSCEAIISYPGRNRCTACSFLSEQHLVPPARQFPSPCAACPTF